MTLMAGWFEKNDWGVAYQVISPEEAREEAQGPPLWGGKIPVDEPRSLELSQELQDFFLGELVLVTTQPIPEGANLLLFFHPPGFFFALVVGAENLNTSPQMRPGYFRLSLRILSIRKTPMDGVQRLN